jgi:hypothetical protein
MTYKQQFNRKYGQPVNAPNSIPEISLRSGYALDGLMVIYEKGVGAFFSNRQSVRPHVTSATQWGIARVYAAINKSSKSYKIDKSHLNKVDYHIFPSTRKYKKWTVVTPTGKRIHFGDNRYEDYTIHKDKKRYLLYLKRHEKNENWTFDGVETAGFWSRWILWNKPSFDKSINNTERTFGIRIHKG